MTWRTLVVQNGGSLRLRQRQLVYQPPADVPGEPLSVPVEDLMVVVLESHQLTLSNALLSALLEFGCVVLTCDAKHLPQGMMLPFLQHSRAAEIAALQVSWSEPFRKRCWQAIIQTKISNQAAVLQGLGHLDAAARMQAIVREVQSGDASNRESVASRMYWQYYHGPGIHRRSETMANMALNYGYALVRGCMARALVASGLLPCFGLHHSNQLNGFNLADDLMEPFRPMVDVLVATLNGLENSEAESRLPAEVRHSLAGLPASTVSLGDEVLGLAQACEETASSLVRAIRAKEPKALRLPSLLN